MNNQMSADKKEKFEVLLMKAVDGEISSAEQEEFEQFIYRYPECKKEWRQLRKLKEVTKTMRFKSPPGEVWDTYWVNIYNRLERGVAWVLFSIGSVILLTYGGFKIIEAIITDPQMAGIVKVGLMLAIGGLVMLLVSVFREKFFTFRNDPYKEIQR